VIPSDDFFLYKMGYACGAVDLHAIKAENAGRRRPQDYCDQFNYHRSLCHDYSIQKAIELFKDNQRTSFSMSPNLAERLMWLSCPNSNSPTSCISQFQKKAKML